MKWTVEQAVAVLGIGTPLLRWRSRAQRVLRIVARKAARVSAGRRKKASATSDGRCSEPVLT
jgi:hypothetical protein